MSVAAVGVLLSPPLFVTFSGGRATNDIAGIALFLASIALLLNSRGRRAAVAVAAVAAGLAFGTKLTMAVPIAALTVGVIAIGATKSRRMTALVWVPLVLVTGGYWYVRNLVAVGNPIPALQVGLGPVSLPSATSTAGRYSSYSVVHYLTDISVWRDWFIPGLHQAFGLAYPIILGLAATGLLLAVVRGDRTMRMLGIVGIVSFLGYLATPASAGGASGRPVLFASDTRFALPALAIGMILLPRLVRRPSTESPARLWLPALLTIALVSDVAYAFSGSAGKSAAAFLVEMIAVSIVIGLALVWVNAFAAVVRGRGMHRRRRCRRRRIPGRALVREQPLRERGGQPAVRKRAARRTGCHRQLDPRRVGRPDRSQRSGRVLQLVRRRPVEPRPVRGASRATWRVRRGDDVCGVATTAQRRSLRLRRDQSGLEEPARAADRGVDAIRSRRAEQIVRSGKASVFRVKGPFDPSTCPSP